MMMTNINKTITRISAGGPGWLCRVDGHLIACHRLFTFLDFREYRRIYEIDSNI